MKQQNPLSSETPPPLHPLLSVCPALANYSPTDFLGRSVLAKHSGQVRGVSFRGTNSASALILQPELGGDQKPRYIMDS